MAEDLRAARLVADIWREQLAAAEARANSAEALLHAVQQNRDHYVKRAEAAERQLAAAREALDVCKIAFVEAEKLYQNGIVNSPEGTSDKVAALRQTARRMIDTALSDAPAPPSMSEREPGQLAFEAWRPDDYPWENTPHKAAWARVEATIRAAGPFLIWSNEHRLWWRPNRCGYTIDAAQAGRYSHAEALAICRAARDGWRPGEPPPEIPVAESDVAFCADPLERLTARDPPALGEP